MKTYKVLVKEIPNSYIKRGPDYKQSYTINADCATYAKQEALDRFGDFSKVVICVEVDLDYPEVYNHIEPEDE